MIVIVLIFKLKTVVYSMSSATNCLKVGLDCKDPKISKIIRYDFYVDDLLTGGSELTEVKYIRDEVTKELALAYMPLRKWKFNEPRLVWDVGSTSLDLNIGSAEPDKLLGLGWYADSDELGIPIKLADSSAGHTKRDLLSVIARIFIP